MLKHMLKLIGNSSRGRGVKAPALLALPNLLLQRFGRASRGQAFAGAGVILAAVVGVSLLTWLNDVHKPLARSIEAVERALPEVLEQVDGQMATLLGVDEETVQNVREDLEKPASGIVRIANAGSLASAGPDTLLMPSTATPEQSTSQPSTDETPPPPATEEPPPTTSEPTPSPTSEEPSPPTTEEPPPVPEEPPPVTEEPPPPATENPPPATEEPPPAPPGEAPPATDEPPTSDEPAPPPTEDSSPAPEVPLPKAGEPPPPGGHG